MQPLHTESQGLPGPPSVAHGLAGPLRHPRAFWGLSEPPRASTELSEPLRAFWCLSGSPWASQGPSVTFQSLPGPSGAFQGLPRSPGASPAPLGLSRKKQCRGRAGLWLPRSRRPGTDAPNRAKAASHVGAPSAYARGARRSFSHAAL